MTTTLTGSTLLLNLLVRSDILDAGNGDERDDLENKVFEEGV